MVPTRDRSFGAEVLARFVPDVPVAWNLLDVTVRMIDDSGEVALRVQDVVNAAGVQIPILYRHFGSREGLVKAAHVQRMITEIGDGIGGIAAEVRDSSSPMQFRRIIDRMIDNAISEELRDSRAKQVSILGACYGRPDLTSAISSLEHSARRALADALAPAQDRGWTDADLDRLVFAEWFYSQLLARFVVEIDDEVSSISGWDEIFRRTALIELFGSD